MNAISALLVKVGVNMGDHAQDVTAALTVKPDETVAALVERALHSQEYRWNSDSTTGGVVPVAQPEWRLELRIAIEEAESRG